MGFGKGAFFGARHSVADHFAVGALLALTREIRRASPIGAARRGPGRIYTGASLHLAEAYALG